MDEKKLFNRTCPKCGEIYRDRQVAKAGLSGVQLNLICDQGHMWSEFYSLVYQGYWWNGKMYDTEGEVMPDRSI